MGEIRAGVTGFFSAADAARASRVLERLGPHYISEWALAGGFAIAIRCGEPRALDDIDFVVSSFEAIPESLAGDFLFRHVHRFDPHQQNAFAEADLLLRGLMPVRDELLIVPQYPQDTAASCPRCIPDPVFPLADRNRILSLLGYC